MGLHFFIPFKVTNGEKQDVILSTIWTIFVYYLMLLTWLVRSEVNLDRIILYYITVKFSIYYYVSLVYGYVYNLYAIQLVCNTVPPRHPIFELMMDIQKVMIILISYCILNLIIDKLLLMS